LTGPLFLERTSRDSRRDRSSGVGGAGGTYHSSLLGGNSGRVRGEDVRLPGYFAGAAGSGVRNLGSLMEPPGLTNLPLTRSRNDGDFHEMLSIEIYRREKARMI
jgi:hypothetical protein